MIPDNFVAGTSEPADLILINSPLRDYDVAQRLNDFTLPTLGLGYIATCAKAAGFSVGVLDAEALGLGVHKTADLINRLHPRWIGMNLLAPTYRYSKAILQNLAPEIRVMLGGHQAKAMPAAILADSNIPRIDAMILGEAETRVPRLLEDVNSRTSLPAIRWKEDGVAFASRSKDGNSEWLAPNIDALPLLNRDFLKQDPYSDHGILESAMVASRGCPFDCSFCGAAVSANPDVTIRMRSPANILEEMFLLKQQYGIDRVRFVDDLFLANRKAIRRTLGAFISEGVNLPWDATGRINVLAGASIQLYDLLIKAGCREVALGIETGSDRLLRHIDKKISVAQTESVVENLCRTGINVKGYFILGLPSETRDEHVQTLALIERLWAVTAPLPGRFRCSVFEYRPYPGTPDWARLKSAGYLEEQMLDYESPALDNELVVCQTPERDEFNFSTGLQFGEVPIREVRRNLADIMKRQYLQ